MVNFRLNKQLDKDMASQFLGIEFKGVDFGRGVWGYHPELKDLTSEDEKTIGEYFDRFYQTNEESLFGKANQFQRQWDEVEAAFVLETERIFNGYKFPRGKYVGYVSALNCNPRFLEDKTFQLFYEAESSVGTTSHELMHFIFYSYTSQNWGSRVKNLDTSDELWWDTSEIFNNIILSSDKFKNILGTEGDMSYPDHEKFIPIATQLYASSSSVDDFIGKLFDLLDAS